MVRQVAAGLLVIYVAIILLATMTSDSLMDKQTAYYIQTTLDLPTAITLIVFSILSVKLELDKPKNRQIQKTTNYDAILLICGTMLTLLMVYIKYFI